MTPQTELDSLFAQVWTGRCPAEVLADWLLERADSQSEFKTSYLYLNEDRLDPDWTSLVITTLTTGKVERLYVTLQIRNKELNRSMSFGAEEFSTEFPKWFRRYVDHVNYINQRHQSVAPTNVPTVLE